MKEEACSKDFGGQFSLTFHFHEVLREGPLFRFPLSEAPAITVILLIQMASLKTLLGGLEGQREPCCSIVRNIQWLRTK